MDIWLSIQKVFKKQKNVTEKKTQTSPEYSEIMKQMQIIKNWKPQSDVWPLRFGRTILMCAASASAMYINHRFRAKLKLRTHGTVLTMFGIMMSTNTATAILHSEVVVKNIMLLQISCPLCMESKSALLQTCSGLLFPLIVTPFANFSISAGSGVYNVPHITDGRKIFGTIWSIYQPMLPKIAIIFTLQALLASYITYLEIKYFLRLLDLQYLMKESENYQQIM